MYVCALKHIYIYIYYVYIYIYIYIYIHNYVWGGRTRFDAQAPRPAPGLGPRAARSGRCVLNTVSEQSGFFHYISVENQLPITTFGPSFLFVVFLEFRALCRGAGG